MAAFRVWMERNGDGVRNVWADGMTRHVLKTFRQTPLGGRAWTAEVRKLRPGGAGPAPGDLIVLFDVESGTVCGLCRKSAGETLGNPVVPAAGWRQVHGTRDGVLRVYRMDHTMRPPGQEG
jgi:hypothetical protein